MAQKNISLVSLELPLQREGEAVAVPRATGYIGGSGRCKGKTLKAIFSSSALTSQEREPTQHAQLPGLFQPSNLIDLFL